MRTVESYNHHSLTTYKTNKLPYHIVFYLNHHLYALVLEVIQSLEPGELWRWNYATESEVV